ncbi:hypothetical protein [Humibacillus xanthopallidus]|uniref:Uncharacterized protein n=1 Tax=Humibacillus xanthopallidus TaxID=412689 RepID=A0A543HW19_9MICO|nr:hypothetical protein [Humibacillus xanthopallidus]TQM62506.1 hypothetical protein FBY41_2540 [Humibacillus xanthopallidus]
MWLDLMTSQALNGQLPSPPGSQIIYSAKSSTAVTVDNRLPIPILVVQLDTSGAHCDPVVPVPATSSEVLHSWYGNGYAAVLAPATGGFICFLGPLPGTPTATTFTVDADALLRPNAIGPVPLPTNDSIIPADSARVVVGCGQAANGANLLREQYWQRLPESTTLSPDELLTRATTVVSGMSDTTSAQQELQSSLGLSASGGWGAVSASVSSTLSLSSTSFQQVTVTTESTIFNSSTFDNSGSGGAYLLFWQLTDVVTVLDASGQPKASVVTAIPPAIVARHTLPGDVAQFTVPAGLAPGRHLVTARSNDLTATADLVIPGGPLASLMPQYGAAGTDVQLLASGFASGQAFEVEIEVSPGSDTYGAATVSPVGGVTTPDGSIPPGTTLTLPSAPGDYALRVSVGSSESSMTCTVLAPEILLTPAVAGPGSTVAVTGAAFPPDSTVVLSVTDGMTETTLVSLSTDDAGNVTGEEA